MQFSIHLTRHVRLHSQGKEGILATLRELLTTDSGESACRLPAQARKEIHMFRQNLHAHSTYDDGKSTVRVMIEASMAAGLTSVGISVHSPLPYESDWDISAQKLDAYLAELRALRQRQNNRRHQHHRGLSVIIQKSAVSDRYIEWPRPS